MCIGKECIYHAKAKSGYILYYYIPVCVAKVIHYKDHIDVTINAVQTLLSPFLLA